MIEDSICNSRDIAHTWKTIHFHNSISQILLQTPIYAIGRNSLQPSDLGNIENMQDCPKPKVLKLLPFSQSKLQLSTNGKGIYVQHLLIKPTFEVPSGAFYIVMLHNCHTVSPDSKWQTHQIHSKWQCLITL